MNSKLEIRWTNNHLPKCHEIDYKGEMKRYAVIDVETTGGSAYSHKIIEIGVVLIDGDKITQTYSTFINPERPIPYGITRLTGIDDSMVVGAPKFYQVAKKIIELTADRIFVAHNVHFDFSFVHKEFADLGFSFKAEKLCTVRLARTHFPGLASYSLGKLCQDIGIKLEHAHRALDDARASAEILVKILKNETEVVAEKLAFPPHLDPTEYEALPMEIGVYEFFDQEGYLLYVGKSRYIKSRVAGHFRVGFDRKYELQFKNQISTVRATQTYSELLALLLEDTWIKEKRPRFNISSRRIFEEYGLYEDQDAVGEWCLRVKKIHNDLTPLITVKSRRSGEYYIKKLMGQAQAMNSGATIREKVLSLIEAQHYPYDDFNIVEGSVVVKVREGRLLEAEVYHPEEGELLNTYKLREGLDARRIILAYSLKKRLKMVPVFPEFL